MKEEKFPHSRTPSHRQVCENFGISAGNIPGRKKKKKTTEYVPNCNCREVAQTLGSTTSEQGVDREERAA